MRKIYIALPALVTFLVALQFFGVDLIRYRPVMVYEAEASNTLMVNHICGKLLNEWYIAKDLQAKYQRDGEPTPVWLIQKLILIERQISELGCRD